MGKTKADLGNSFKIERYETINPSILLTLREEHYCIHPSFPVRRVLLSKLLGRSTTDSYLFTPDLVDLPRSQLALVIQIDSLVCGTFESRASAKLMVQSLTAWTYQHNTGLATPQGTIKSRIAYNKTSCKLCDSKPMPRVCTGRTGSSNRFPKPWILVLVQVNSRPISFDILIEKLRTTIKSS